MSAYNRLRVHLVGGDQTAKHRLAVLIRKELNKVAGRTTLVPDLRTKTTERVLEISGPQAKDSHLYFMCLENDYIRQQVAIATKTHHLVFEDSLVDRFHRSEEAGMNMGVYFEPYLKSSQDCHIFLYGPNIDEQRSQIIHDYSLPVQVWGGDLAEAGVVRSIIDSILLRLKRNGKGRK